MCSWIRAPPESWMPTMGQPAFRAISCTFTIFWACISPSEPPITVKSWEKAYTVRPSTVPKPVITPSAGVSRLSMPSSVPRWRTCRSISTKEPGSNRSASRSRAVSFPCSFRLARAFSPPPRRSRASRA